MLNKLILNGVGVEIGVQRGFFSEHILQQSNLKVLYSIDPWTEFDKDEYIDVSNVQQSEHNMLYSETISRLIKYGNRSVVMRSTSEDAAYIFRDGLLDFAYIDANHAYDSCKKDLELWWPKMKIGGIFAGHDYLNGTICDCVFGVFEVKRAVDEFVKKHGLQLYVTSEEWPSWYLMVV